MMLKIRRRPVGGEDFEFLEADVPGVFKLLHGIYLLPDTAEKSRRLMSRATSVTPSQHGHWQQSADSEPLRAIRVLKASLA